MSVKYLARGILAVAIAAIVYALADVKVGTRDDMAIWGFESPVPLWVMIAYAFAWSVGIVGVIALVVWACINAFKEDN